jgi:hypothetical protein
MNNFLIRLGLILLITLPWSSPALCINSGRIALHEEVLKDHKDVVTSILTKGGDPNAKDNNGVTPLHLAAAKGYKDMALLLLNKGGDVNAETSFGSTPLDMAMAIGNEEIQGIGIRQAKIGRLFRAVRTKTPIFKTSFRMCERCLNLLPAHHKQTDPDRTFLGRRISEDDRLFPSFLRLY